MISKFRSQPTRLRHRNLVQPKLGPMFVREIQRLMLKAQIRSDNRVSQIMARAGRPSTWWESDHKWEGAENA